MPPWREKAARPWASLKVKGLGFRFHSRGGPGGCFSPAALAFVVRRVVKPDLSHVYVHLCRPELAVLAAAFPLLPSASLWSIQLKPGMDIMPTSETLHPAPRTSRKVSQVWLFYDYACTWNSEDELRTIFQPA